MALTASARVLVRGGAVERTGEVLAASVVAERVGWCAALVRGMAAGIVSALWQGTAPGIGTNGFKRGCATVFRSALSYWHPAAVVADTTQGTPLARFLTGQLGAPAAQAGQVLAWRSTGAG